MGMQAPEPINERCPRCHRPSLFAVREELPIKVPCEEAGQIVQREGKKTVFVRVCSACDYRSDS
jgi:hypothetical protein